ncbi:unnamed protein product [Caenorhabditis brenneri]
MKTVILIFLFSLVGPAAFLSCYSNSQYADDPHILKNQKFCASIYSLEDNAFAYSGSQRMLSKEEKLHWLADACQENTVTLKYLPPMTFTRCLCFSDLCNLPTQYSNFKRTLLPVNN